MLIQLYFSVARYREDSEQVVATYKMPVEIVDCNYAVIS